MANRTIAIGDIHGCADALRALLDVIRPDPSDTLIPVGDYVDRGPASSDVIDVMTELVSVCTVIPLRGNHEIMMDQGLQNRREFEFWLFNGGKATLQSYGGDMNNMPMHHRTFLKFLKPYHETDTHIFLHAAYDHRLPMARQPEEILFWQHIDERFMPLPHTSGKIVVCGHTPQVEGEIGDLGHIKLIDTFCYGDGWLTAYDVDSGEYIQARMDGMLRADRSKFSTVTLAPPTKMPDTRPAPVAGGNAISEDYETAFPVKPNDWKFSDAKPSELELNGKQFQSILKDVGQRLANELDNLDRFPHQNMPPVDGNLEQTLKELNEPLPRHSGELEPILNQIFDKCVPPGFNTPGAGYLAYIPGGGLPESAIADLITSITNRYVTVWQAAPAMAQIESTVIRWFCDMIGLPHTAGGFLTTGGSLANLSGIITARAQRLDDNFSTARIYCSSQVHHCVNKAAWMAGFPKNNIRNIKVNSDQSLDLQDLRVNIDSDRNAGMNPFLVVANAGTTNTGAVDDLQSIRDICDEQELWMHVDAAYGGFFVLTESGRQALQGISTADSIVLDPHKGLFLPYGTGCLLVKDRSMLVDTFSFTSEYMPDMTGDRSREDFCEISPELSRDNRGLRIWLPLKLHGLNVFRDLLEEKLQLTRWATTQLKELGVQLKSQRESTSINFVAPPKLSIVAFCLVDSECSLEENNAMNTRWLEEINRDGSIMMTSTMIDGRYVLRICVLSFRTHIQRMQKAMGIISNSANRVLNAEPSEAN